MTTGTRESADDAARDAEPSRRPATVLAMAPEFVPALFDTEARKRLRTFASIDPDTVVHGPIHAEAGLAETEVLLTCWGAPRLDGATLAALPRLRAVIHAAGSVKGIVTDACRAAGIQVSSAAAMNAVPVAEHTVAMILLSNKRTLWLARRYSELRGAWHASEIPHDIGNYGTTVGIVGASWIGRRVIELLRPYDLHVLLADPYLQADQARRLGVELVDLDELCRRSHIVSLHAPALPSTRHLLDASRLAAMGTGTTVINTARGTLIDTAALTREVASGRLYAVLDHTDPRILPDDSPLYDSPNVLLTPHIAGSHGNELRRLGRSAVDELIRYATGEPFAYPVRYADLERSA
ncbi:hydroxyacid dehydrogenase [Rugosimonospora africana]|uniref:2-hydroxyacid dehydrogenase n=1 Tax=Rugosimonospora africana TaxID=556532 RepID=A0A8J3QQ65_9ACTN|nr:hydroxyacid dehydrogenase [Rugosimonospora africana]GIH14913.1 2-hydroxyacid dehydrogenase [Rugosimonospora africana]